MKRIGVLVLLCGLLLPTNKVQAEQIGVDIVAKVEEVVVPVMEKPGDDKLPKIITTALGITATGLAGGGGLLFLVWRRKKKFHGIYLDTTEAGEDWHVPTLADKLRDGEITVEEYITTLEQCGRYTKFPADTKMTIRIGEEMFTMDASEKVLFTFLRETDGRMEATFTSARTGLHCEVVYKDY